MVDLKQIKELMSNMKKEGIQELEITEKDVTIKLKREVKQQGPAQLPQPIYYPHHDVRVSHPPMPHKLEHSPVVEPDKKIETGKVVNSPMVGTLYTAPSPEDPPFIKVGDRVEENTIVCIIEAMKVMNEVKAGVSGTVAEIYVNNGSPVEFGTKLVRVL